MGKEEGAVFESVSSGSIGKIVREAKGDIVVAIGTYDALSKPSFTQEVDEPLSSKRPVYRTILATQ